MMSIKSAAGLHVVDRRFPRVVAPEFLVLALLVLTSFACSTESGSPDATASVAGDTSSDSRSEPVARAEPPTGDAGAPDAERPGVTTRPEPTGGLCEAIDQGVDETRAVLARGADPATTCRELVTESTGVGLAMRIQEAPALVVAASRGDNDVIQLLLEAGAPISGQDEGGKNALIAAARAGGAAAVRMLLANGAQPDFRDNGGRTALMQVNEEPVLTAFFLAQVGRASDATAALEEERSAQEGVAIVQALVAAGADVALVDDEGMTALIHATAAGRDYLVSAFSSGAPRGVEAGGLEGIASRSDDVATSEPAFDPQRIADLRHSANRAGVNEFYVFASSPSLPTIDEMLSSECERVILWNGAAARVYGRNAVTLRDRFPDSCAIEFGVNAGNLADEMLRKVYFARGHIDQVLYEFWPRRLVRGETDTRFLLYEGGVGTSTVSTVGRRAADSVPPNPNNE